MTIFQAEAEEIEQYRNALAAAILYQMRDLGLLHFIEDITDETLQRFWLEFFACESELAEFDEFAALAEDIGN